MLSQTLWQISFRHTNISDAFNAAQSGIAETINLNHGALFQRHVRLVHRSSILNYRKAYAEMLDKSRGAIKGIELGFWTAGKRWGLAYSCHGNVFTLIPVLLPVSLPVWSRFRI